MKEVRKLILEITYQPINDCWGANIKYGNCITNEVDKELLVVLKKIGETILLTQNLTIEDICPPQKN